MFLRLSLFFSLLFVALIAGGAVAISYDPPQKATAEDSVSAENQDVATTTAPPPVETHLSAARKAAADGNDDLAIDEYLGSLAKEPESLPEAVPELLKLVDRRAGADRDNERWAEESATLNECYRWVLAAKSNYEKSDSSTAAGRATLHDAQDRVNTLCREAVQRHIEAAAKLRDDAKWGLRPCGLTIWTWNDNDMRMDALHRANLAMSYYPQHTDEAAVKSIYALQSEMKDVLATWRYERVMQQDRLLLAPSVDLRSPSGPNP